MIPSSGSDATPNKQCTDTSNATTNNTLLGEASPTPRSLYKCQHTDHHHHLSVTNVLLLKQSSASTQSSGIILSSYSTRAVTNLHDSRQGNASELQIQRYSRDTSSAVTNNTLSKRHPHLLLAQKLSLERVGPPHPHSRNRVIQRYRTCLQHTRGDKPT